MISNLSGINIFKITHLSRPDERNFMRYVRSCLKNCNKVVQAYPKESKDEVQRIKFIFEDAIINKYKYIIFTDTILGFLDRSHNDIKEKMSLLAYIKNFYLTQNISLIFVSNMNISDGIYYIMKELSQYTTLYTIQNTYTATDDVRMQNMSTGESKDFEKVTFKRAIQLNYILRDDNK